MVPYEGKVCPYCGAEKSDAKARLEKVGYWGAGGAVIAALLSVVLTGAPVPVAGCMGFGGFILGAATGSVVTALQRK